MEIKIKLQVLRSLASNLKDIEGNQESACIPITKGMPTLGIYYLIPTSWGLRIDLSTPIITIIVIIVILFFIT
jgi:hypothetical protein